ncbi:glycosyltransferase [Belnapia moabensis]|uniref:glycosyltransferase n=1 Tax=Belnapia moabensis TaxID=365533 RepID=UPI0014706C75|nr:glycosyltransferase [Belnapia moabensis]
MPDDASPLPLDSNPEAASMPKNVVPRLRVLHVYLRFHPDYTGDGIYYTRLIPHLVARGIDSEVLAYSTVPTEGGETGQHQGIPVHYLAKRDGRSTLTGLIRWLAANLHRFNLVHLHSHVDRRFLAYAFIRLCGRPVLFSCTLDDSPTQVLENYKIYNRSLVAQLMRTVSGFVVISPQLLRRSLETMPMERLHFIPQGVALDVRPGTEAERQAARAALGLGARDLLLLNVGSVSRRKNIRFLVDALARIPDSAVKLLLVGPTLEDDYLAELEARIAELGLNGRIVIAGFQSDPAPWYTAADALVFASTSEGFPNVYLEAMARGLPIVSLFLPGLTDFIIDHGRTGFLARDEAQFVEAIGQLRANPDLGASMGSANRQFAERNLEIGAVATSYATLYRWHRAGRRGGRVHQSDCPDLQLRFVDRLRTEGPAAIGLVEFNTPTDWRPMLQVVIDTEADFDWNKGVATDIGAVASIIGLRDSFEVFRRHGVRPTLVIDYPVANQSLGREVVRELAAEGCEIGVHMHPWTTPPLVEIKDDWHSFSGNLGPWLERAKLEALKQRVEDLTGHPSRIFKAGRYGLGPNTADALEALGFEVDLSISPHYNYAHLGGPDFSRFTSRPGWFGRSHRLLSLPTTGAPLGWLGARAAVPVHSRWGRRLHLGGIASWLGAFRPIRLSPEGHTLAELQAVTCKLHREGLRVFTLSLHSPTLQVGHTPYTPTQESMRALLGTIDDYLAFFRGELGGSFTTSSALHTRLSTLSRSASDQVVPSSARNMF